MDDAIKVLRDTVADSEKCCAFSEGIDKCDVCQARRQALAAIERLVEAVKALLVVRAGPTPTDASPYYRAVTELNDALAAVLGDKDKTP
jgi:hypothetical protein